MNDSATHPAQQLTAGRGGLPRLILAAPDGARAEIYLHGAHVTSWRPAGGPERLFLSPAARFLPGQGIRGGVPVAFPQFADVGPLPMHGFARKTSWELTAISGDGSTASATLRLADSADTRSLWPHAFLAELRVAIGGPRLEVALAVTNTGQAPFSFTGALHTYLAVAAIEDVAVEGLQGIMYIDKVARGRRSSQEESVLRIRAETDRVYLNAPRRVVVSGPAGRLAVSAAGFPDVVVWNPWNKAASIPDMEPDDYRSMLCIEAAIVGTPAQVDPGRRWAGSQTLLALNP